MLKSPDDPRLKEREFQLLQNKWLGNNISNNDLAIFSLNKKFKNKIHYDEQLFEVEELQKLWENAIKKDMTFLDYTKQFRTKRGFSLRSWSQNLSFRIRSQ